MAKLLKADTVLGISKRVSLTTIVIGRLVSLVGILDAVDGPPDNHAEKTPVDRVELPSRSST